MLMSACSLTKNVPDGYYLLKKNKIKYVEYIDPSTKNDHEWGSIGRVSKEFNPPTSAKVTNSEKLF